MAVAEPYPGEDARPDDMLTLAREYHRAANALLPLGRKGKPVSRAPWRLTALHAIELYLNALLLHGGMTAAEIRGLHHDLAARRDRALGTGLKLRERTADHLSSLTERREYVAVRYAAGDPLALSQINRIQATLEEVAARAQAAVAAPA